MAPPDHHPHRETQNGFVVVAVLWILGALATLATVYTLYVSESAAALASYSERLQAQGLALAGVEVAVYRLTENPNAPPARGTFAFRLGKARVAVRFRTETARIDLNFAGKELLSGLFTAIGANRQNADQFADRIIGWRTPLTADAKDTETSLYLTAGMAHGPRHGPFQHINELGLVLGLPANLVDRALPFLTVYSGRAEVNVLNAAPEVLAALPGMTPESLYLLLDQRELGSLDVVRARLGTAASYATLSSSNANRITVDVRFDNKHEMRSEAVVLLLKDDTEPYRLLSWSDEIGTSTKDGGGNTSLR
jgi:general secretion pathway protein K